MGLSGDRRSSAKLIKLDICFAELRRPECNSAIDNTLLSSPPSLPSWRARDDIRDPFIRLESSLAFLARHRSLAASSHRHLVSRSGKQNVRMFQTRFSIRWLNALRDNERGHPRGYRLRSLPLPHVLLLAANIPTKFPAIAIPREARPIPRPVGSFADVRGLSTRRRLQTRFRDGISVSHRNPDAGANATGVTFKFTASPRLVTV